MAHDLGELASLAYFEGYKSAAEVRAHDDPLLEEIGGSYEEIAQRLRDFMEGKYNHNRYFVQNLGVRMPGSARCPVSSC
jgi:hypothetical protein